ncbi:MAG: FAD-dependent oxidoreductase [Oscillospiraceae bacterium]|nr:FAD-dependent oxidoreductase [Oscillospiraceae bacterium]
MNTAVIKRIWGLILVVVLIVLAVVGWLLYCGLVRGKPVERPVIDGALGYHVIVVGGEPEGIAAALAAARNGMSTLLVEEGDALGGLFTLGMLNFLDMNQSKDATNHLLTQGIFKEFYNALGNAFDIEEAKAWFLRKCRDEPNLTVMLGAKIISPLMDGNAITGLEVMESGNSSFSLLRGLTFIDATPNGDIAAAAGAPFTIGAEDYGEHGVLQGVTLVFEVSGVDWGAVSDYLKNDGNPSSGADSVSAWGYGEEASNYVPMDSNMRFRGPNIARQKNGDVLLNALLIFGVDALDPKSYAEGIERGQLEILHIVEFMRNNFVGFENASYVSRAPRLYVRETRHFIGEYRLTITDVLENRDQWDRIGHGNYPVDIQPTSPDNSGNIIGAPDKYSIPFRCLVPLKVDQLLIAGRSASYDSLPHGSARVVPIGMVAGEACGVAAAYSVNSGVTFRQMTVDSEAILWLQTQLKKQGAYLTEYTPARIEAMDHWAYPGLAAIRELGLAYGGYSNDYRLDDEVPHRWALQNRLNHVMAVMNERTVDRGNFRIPAWEISLDTDEVPVGLVLIKTAECASLADWNRFPQGHPNTGQQPEPMAFENPAEAMTYLVNLGILDEGVVAHFPDFDAISTNSQLFYIVGALYISLMEW